MDLLSRLKGILGSYEAAGSIGSGLLAQPIAGLAGILATPGGPEKAANAVRTTQNALTYQPRTDAGVNALASIGSVMEPVSNALSRVQQATGDAGYAVGGPVGGMLGATLPDAAMMALPVKRGGILNNAMTPKTLDPQLGAIVWHGSPHKFDKFDMSKIGTGEGAQAYGHGMYFADNPGVAKGYREALTNPNGSSSPRMSTSFKVDGREYFQPSEEWAAADMANTMKKYGVDPKTKDGREWLNGEAGARYMGGQTNDVNALKKQAIKFFGSNVVEDTTRGALYKVDLPDSAISQMLDWDKPLSQQPKNVRDAFDSFVNSPEGLAMAREYHGYKEGMKLTDLPAFNLGGKSSVSGQLFYKLFGGGEAATEKLKQMGITGIRYLDGGSRDAGKGTYNYVVFDDKLPKIVGRE